jgi:hypothetical protein
MWDVRDVWLRHTVIQHEINASVFQSRYVLPCGVLIVLENELFARVLGIPTNRLEVLDVLHCHVGEKTEVLVRRSSQLTMGRIVERGDLR